MDPSNNPETRADQAPPESSSANSDRRVHVVAARHQSNAVEESENQDDQNASTAEVPHSAFHRAEISWQEIACDAECSNVYGQLANARRGPSRPPKTNVNEVSSDDILRASTSVSTSYDPDTRRA